MAILRRPSQEPQGKPRGLLGQINWITFLPAAILVVALIIWGGVSQDSFSGAMSRAMRFMLENFSWAYALLVFALLVFCLYVACSKYGKIRIGGEDAKPAIPFFTWFAISLTSGIAVGIMFWGVAEPLTFFHNPPTYLGIDGGTVEAAETSLRYVFFHWALNPYALFTAAGVGLAYAFYNGKRKYKVSSGLYPLIGERADGLAGNLIDSWCVFGVIGGQTTSLGLGIMQLTGGFNFVSGSNIDSPLLYFGCIAALEVVCIAAACSGLHKGIAHISRFNMYIYFFMMAAVFITGGVLLILNNTVSSLGAYLGGIVEQSLYLEPFKATGWVQNWSIFYWAWWVGPAPIIGLFLIRLAKGRTIREFITVNLFAPSLFGIIWFGIFGTTAINLDLNGANIMGDIDVHGVQVALFSFFQKLPFSPLLIVVGFLACVFSIITMHEAMILSLSDSASRTGFNLQNDQASPNSLKVFWGVTIGFFCVLMVITGGLSAVQTASILTGLPSLILIVIMCAGFLKAVRRPQKYDLTLREEGDSSEAPE